jgi:hypothetical protein
MKHSRLVAFGCSITFGHGLKDCYSGKRKIGPGDQPSKYAWPSVLADILGLECVNLSSPGSSNKRIAHTLCSTELTDTDLVIVNWSYANRYCVITENEIIDLGFFKGRDKINKSFKNLANANDLMLDSIMRLDYVKLLLDKNKITNFHTLSTKKDFKNYENENMLTSSIENIRKIFPKALDNSHPGEEAHLQFAQEIYHEIKDRL